MTIVIPNSDDEEDSGKQNPWIHHKSNIINASLEHDERVYSDQEEIEEAEGLFVTEAKDQADNIFGYYEASKLPSRQNQLLLSRMPRRRTRECENHAPHRSLVSSAARRGTIDSLPDNPAADISVPTLQLSQPTKTSKLIPVTSFRERVHDLVKACSGEKQENEWEACRFSIPVVTNESYQVNHAVRNDQSELANDGHLKSQTLDERSKSTAEARTFHEQSWVNCRFESVAGAAAAGDPQTHQHNSISNNIHVMYSKLREPLPESKSRDLKAKRTLGNVNKGWGTNFVRTNLKNGKAGCRVAGLKWNRGRSSKFKWRQKGSQFSSQAGVGAEYVEGWETTVNFSCYKCGLRGHIARNCPSHDGIPNCAMKDDQGTSFQIKESNFQEPFNTVECQELVDKSEHELTIFLKSQFHHDSFRGLQLPTIQLILRGESCLSIMATGMGKSLCYQLPALLLPGLTFVLSPLVALMHDQVKAAPKELNAVMLWSGQTPAQAQEVLGKIAEGATKLLFVSPERLGNSALLTALRNRMPLSLVVVDEAHCISEWGHSFRPSYFRLAKELNQNIVTRSVLAITATATKSTEVNLCNALQISSSNVMRDKTIRSNLKLHVLRAFSSTSDNPEGCARIVRLLQKGPLVHARSIIIFCAWKRDVESLTKSLLHAGINSEAYHAGRHHNDRDAIERAFRNGKLRVVVATLAFGMGIDISTVDAVIHASMPRSLEEYVQQIGRAGRNDIEANCYLYLIDSDFLALRSLAFSGMVEREGICVLMSALFEERKDCQVPYFQNLSLQKLSLRSDISEESIETLLAYLEDMMPDAIDILPKMPLKVKVSFYDGSPEQLALRSDAVKALLSLCPRPRNGVYSAMTSQLANEMKKPPAAVLEELQLIASEKLIGFNFSQEQGVMVKVLSRPDNPASLTDQLYSRYRKLVMHQVLRLDNAYRVFDLAVSAAFSSTGEDSEQSLRNSLDHYFSGNAELCPEDIEDISGLPLKELHSGVQKAVEAVCREVQELSQFAPSAIAVARILHGCGSPAMPARDWAKKLGSFWGCYRDVDFLKLLDACQPIVLRLAK